MVLVLVGAASILLSERARISSMQTEIDSYVGQGATSSVTRSSDAIGGHSRRQRVSTAKSKRRSGRDSSNQLETETEGRSLEVTDAIQVTENGQDPETLETDDAQETLHTPKGVLQLQLRPERVKKESEKTALLVFEDDTFDLSGDSGTIGCLKWSHHPATGNVGLCLDLKGVVYEAHSFPLCGSGLVVDLTNQRVETVLNEVTYLRPSSSNNDAGHFIRGTLEPFQNGGSIAADNPDSAWTATAVAPRPGAGKPHLPHSLETESAEQKGDALGPEGFDAG